MKSFLFVLLFSSLTLAQSFLDYDLFYSDQISDDRSNNINIMLNAGAKNTSDFIQTIATGDPDGFYINSTFSITEIGSNRWLRLEREGSPNAYAGIQGGTGFGVADPDNGEMFTAGKSYIIRIKFNSNGAHLRIIPCGNSPIELPVISDIYIYETEVTAITNENLLFSFNGEDDLSKWVEIDYIEVWETN